MDAIELEIGGGWIGSAYSPQVSVTDTEDGHRVEFTYDDAEDGVSTVGYDVPDWSGDEEARKEAERQRQQAESERSQAEAQRAAAESLRASAESSRASAEASREDAEEAREGSEAARQAAFEQAEAQRAAGEQSRVEAESQRVSAETARQEAMAEAVERSQQAEQRADEAYQEASQATAGANDAATRASASATQADQAATRATGSADAADASKAAADQATASANSAATAAGDAAQSATAAAQAATTATGNANAATANANNAAQSASASATAADTAAETANDAAERAEAAIEAIGDISELAVPLMSSTTRGGATLGSGLKVDGGALSIGDVVTDETDGPIYSVDAKGWAEQDGTPTPDNPIEVRVCRGRNLAQATEALPKTIMNAEFLTLNVPDWASVAGKTVTLSIDGTLNSSKKMYAYHYRTGGNSSIASASAGVKSITFTMPEVIGNDNALRIYVQPYDSTPTVIESVQLELGTTPTPYVPYGHVGLEVQGRNLLEPTNAALYRSGNGTLAIDSNNAVSYIARVRRNTDYVVTYNGGNRSNVVGTGSTVPAAGIAGNYVRNTNTRVSPFTFNSGENDYVLVQLGYNSDTPVSEQQLELGTTPTTYEPYTHTTTPILLPLKSDGERWAGGLPDGMADALAIDSAGSCDWESGIALYTVTGNETISGSNQYGDYRRIYFALNTGAGFGATALKPILCTKCPYAYDPGGQFVHGYVNGDSAILFNVGTAATDVLASYAGAEIFYELKNHTTEHGYIDLPEIPEGAVIDIPELREVGVKCFVSGVSELVDHANNWGERCKQNESRIAALEAAIANLATS